MKKEILFSIATFIIVLATSFTTTAFAGLDMSSVPESGGGGGGSGVASIDETGISQSIHMERFNAYLSATNEEAWYHSILNDETGAEEGHWHEKNTHGNLHISTDWALAPYDSHIQFSRWNDEGDFDIQLTSSLVYTDGYVNWPQVPNAGSSWNVGGVNFSTNFSIDKEAEDSEDGIIWQNIWVNGHFYFENAETVNVNLSVNDFIDEFPGISIYGSFQARFLGTREQLAEFNQAVPKALITPEPTTLAFLAFGALAAFRRRREQHRC